MTTSTQSRIDAEAQKDSATLEREIDEQRAEIGHLVHELESKLSPGQLLDSALHYTKGHGGEFMDNLTRTVQNNPVPTLLTGVGLLWLMSSQNRRPASASAPAYVETSTGDTGQSLAEKAKQQAAGLREKAGHLTEKAGHLGESVTGSLDTARQHLSESRQHATESLRHGAQRARSGFDTLLNEQPLVLGAIGVAVGAALAAALPPTPQEDRLMGRASDRLTERAKRKAEEGYHRVSEAGKEMAAQLRTQTTAQAGQHAQSGGPV